MIPCLPALLVGKYVPLDINNMTYVGSFTLPIPPEDFMMSPDGRRFYFCSENTGPRKGITQIDLVTPFSISTGVDNNLTFLPPGVARPKGFTMTPDGNKLIVINTGNGGTGGSSISPLFQYSVTNPLDITSSVDDSLVNSFAGDFANTPRFNSQGSKLRTVQPGSLGDLYSKDIAPDYNINNVSGWDQRLPAPTFQGTDVRAHTWINSNKEVITAGRSGKFIDTYNIIGDDILQITPALTQDIGLIPGSPIITCAGVSMASDGKNLYIADSFSSSTIYQYALL